MSTIKEAREAVAEARNHVENFAMSDGDALRCTRLADTIADLLQVIDNVRAWSDIPLDQPNGGFDALDSILSAAGVGAEGSE